MVSLYSWTQEMRKFWGDQGNGTYINPILSADYSDLDVIRVGNKYYMVYSEFHYMGMPVHNVKLKASYNVRANRHQLYYSLDNKEYIPCGEAYSLKFEDWKGSRIGLYSYHVENESGNAYYNCFRCKFD